ncbi:MAG: hypothetical protein LLG04_12280 [Parachlamydia sp.]|nr:hypothetical protein [Parachlamydia sp.]
MQPLQAQPFQLCVKLASGPIPIVAVRIQILDRQHVIQNTFNQIMHQSTQFLITCPQNAASINVTLGNMHEFA